MTTRISIAAFAAIIISMPAAAAPEHFTPEPGRRVAFSQAEYVAAYRRAEIVSPTDELACGRHVGRRAAAILTQQCKDAAGGSRNGCRFDHPRTCGDLVERLRQFCLLPPSVQGVRCSHEGQ